jgi:bile acid:Na+ symporter, BASS family
VIEIGPDNRHERSQPVSIQELLPIALKSSIILMVFALGLNARVADAIYLFHRPGELVRSLLAMNILMPVIAIVESLVFDLYPAVKVAIVTLSLSPVPPILPKQAVKTIGEASYSVGLLVATALFSIIFIPIAMKVLEMIFSISMQMTMASVAILVAISVLIPLLAGITVHRVAPSLAEKVARPLSIIGTVLLILVLIPVLIAMLPALISVIGEGRILALMSLVIVGIAIGHFLGGPDPEDRTFLAVATASRHPAVALAIANTNFPQQKLTAPIVVVYVILSAIVSVPYIAWAKRQQAHLAGTAKA